MNMQYCHNTVIQRYPVGTLKMFLKQSHQNISQNDNHQPHGSNTEIKLLFILYLYTHKHKGHGLNTIVSISLCTLYYLHGHCGVMWEVQRSNSVHFPGVN